MKILIVAIAGALGALARIGLSQALHRWVGHGFPWGTLCVNLLGCFLLGLALESLKLFQSIPKEWELAITAGFLGAFTTFSTFGWDTIRHLESGNHTIVLLNIASNVVFGCLFVWLGLSLGRSLA